MVREPHQGGNTWELAYLQARQEPTVSVVNIAFLTFQNLGAAFLATSLRSRGWISSKWIRTWSNRVLTAPIFLILCAGELGVLKIRVTLLSTSLSRDFANKQNSLDRPAIGSLQVSPAVSARLSGGDCIGGTKFEG